MTTRPTWFSTLIVSSLNNNSFHVDGGFRRSQATVPFTRTLGMLEEKVNLPLHLGARLEVLLFGIILNARNAFCASIVDSALSRLLGGLGEGGDCRGEGAGLPFGSIHGVVDVRVVRSGPRCSVRHASNRALEL